MQGSSTFVVNFFKLASQFDLQVFCGEVFKLQPIRSAEVHVLFLSCDVDGRHSGFLESGGRFSVVCRRRDFFHGPPLPGVQFGIVFAVPRLQPARADFRGGHFTGAWTSVVQRGMTLMQLAQAVNETPAVITGNIVQIARIEARGGFDPNTFYF
jgi:hypothetical protein